MDLLVTGPASARHTLILAHGAGAPMDSTFMNVIADGLAERGVKVVRFEFPYMAARRTGKKSGPNPERVLLESWRDAIAAVGPPRTLSIGGKSLGGRMASMIADEQGVRGLVCLGYPFHPPGRPDRPRTRHLERLETRALLVQGERDAFGGRQEVAGYRLSPRIELCWMPDGDHSLKPRKSSGQTETQNLEAATVAIAEFLRV